ncbi:hypothetical protein IMCC21906_00175 [Spongiibacter sp. IMCC21906]|nr:hypothetical protein IMCC21906_00175 [Spongiibacter sp. IMCC21906]
MTKLKGTFYPRREPKVRWLSGYQLGGRYDEARRREDEVHKFSSGRSDEARRSSKDGVNAREDRYDRLNGDALNRPGITALSAQYLSWV